MDGKLLKLVNRTQVIGNDAYADVLKFSDALRTDPCHTLEWGTETFRRAAQYHWMLVIVRSVEQLEQKCTCADDIIVSIVAMLRREVMNGALYPLHSTSPASNLMHLTKLQVAAEFLQLWEG